MLNRLDPIKKNKLLLPLFILGILLCWFLAFSKTFDAVMLNAKLKESSEKENDISFNPSYVQQKLSSLDLILKGYQVKEDWKDHLWMQASSIAAKQNVSIDFTLDKPSADVDSISAASQRMQSLYFYGGFIQLVKLVDSLERVKGIGQVSALQLKAPKKDLSNSGRKRCVLRLDFRGIDSNKY
jgi:hypothetical protein